MDRLSRKLAGTGSIYGWLERARYAKRRKGTKDSIEGTIVINKTRTRVDVWGYKGGIARRRMNKKKSECARDKKP